MALQRKPRMRWIVALLVMAFPVSGCGTSVFKGATGNRFLGQNRHPSPNPPSPLEEDQKKCSPANIIDFEDQTGNNIAINDQYKTSHGVSFRLSNDKPVMLATKDTTPRQFECRGGSDEDVSGGGPCSSINNGIRPNSVDIMQQKFIAGELTSSVFLEVAYSQPVKAASGYLLDLDGTEYFIIEAKDASGKVVVEDRSLDSRPPRPQLWKDGQALMWKLESDSANISQLVFRGQRSDGSSAFIAFDRFSPAAVCE